jgi:predicted phage tail protein
MTVATAPRTTHRIRLAGPLGKKFGEEHVYYDLRSPAEAIRLLSINIPAFKKYLEVAHNYGVVFQVLQAGVDIGLEDLHLPLGEKEFIIAPVIVGSFRFFRAVGRAFSGVARAVGKAVSAVGRGIRDFVTSDVGKVVVGAALVAGAIMLGPSAAIGGVGFLGSTGGAGIIGGMAAVSIGNIGVALALGGIANMISPQPEPFDPSSFGGAGGAGDRLTYGQNSQTGGPQNVTRGTDGVQSYAYAGPASSVGLGGVVPVVYGTALTGGGLVSAIVDVTDESDPLLQHIREPGNDTVLIGGEKVTGNWEDASGVPTTRTGAGFYKPLNVSINPDVRGWTWSTVMSSEEGKKLAIGFEVGHLYDDVGIGTTKVDGYLTYRVKCSVKQGESFVDTGSITSTIQALLLSDGKTFGYAQQVDYNSLKSEENGLKVTVEMIDFRSRAASLKVRRLWHVG